ncbi:hypothetical protein ACF064_36305 [Streptomyces sp. NPDC015492]|uniref:hypothetical protein n=1 Tax=Streptomyces sp. NPDC015492 TaxID=3364958 RepID=UPI0036F75199
MSELYEEFDADAEAALDALLARHQESLAATVGPALDVLAGLRWTSELKGSRVRYVADIRAAQSIAEGNCAVWAADNHAIGPAPESSSLSTVLDAVRHEHNKLGAFEHQVVVTRPTTADAEMEWLTVPCAVSDARDQLNRILVLLAGGKATKETARAEFELAIGPLEELYARHLEARAGDDEVSGDAVWMYRRLNTRISGLRRLREQVVRLFEDSDACAFQLS